jgi:hypothetical protein
MTKMDISSWNTYHSVTKVCSVTSKSSLINTFLVVKVPRGYPTLPRSQRQGTLLQCWRSCPSSHPEHRRTTQAQLALGRSLHSCKGDRTGLLPPPDARRRRRQQLVERRPTLSVLRLVYTTTLGAQVYTIASRPLRCKRPPGPGTSLRTTPLQDPAHAATYGSWAATSDKGL